MTLTDLTKKNVLTGLTCLTDPNGKGGKGVRVATMTLRFRPYEVPRNSPGTGLESPLVDRRRKNLCPESA